MKSLLIKILTLSFCLNIFASQNVKALSLFRNKTLIEEKDEKEHELELIKEEIKRLRSQSEINEGQLKKLKTNFFKMLKELKDINTKIARLEAAKIKSTLKKTNEIALKRGSKNKTKKSQTLPKTDFKELTQNIKREIIEEFKNILSEITNIRDIKTILETKLNLILPRMIGTIINLTENSDNPYHTIINNVARNLEKLWVTAQKKIKNTDLTTQKIFENHYINTSTADIIKFDIFEEENKELLAKLEEIIDRKIDEIFMIIGKVLSKLNTKTLERDSDELKKLINQTLDILIHHSFDLLSEISNKILIDWFFIQKDRLALSSMIDNSLIMGKAKTAIENFLSESLDQLLILTYRYRKVLLNDVVITWIQVNILKTLSGYKN